jgi:hypothetical protein
MRVNIPKLSARQASLICLFLLLIIVLASAGKMLAQRASGQPLAQVGPGSPLPVFVVNDPSPALPEGFVPGSSWTFTTWTIPSTLSFTATVQKTEGGWALLKLASDAKPHWYFVPQMPGAWDQQ